MKEYLVSFAKGINQVVDKALIDPGFVTAMDNIDIRSGSMRTMPGLMPMMDPPIAGRINHLSCLGGEANYIFAYGGLIILSANKRSYTTETIGSSSRIFYTEYGAAPMKIVNGAPALLGLRRPAVPPSLSKATVLGINNFVVKEEAGGNIAKDTVRSYRIAIGTDEGVTPPTTKISVKAVGDKVSFRLTWNRTMLEDQVARSIVIFAGDDDKERRIATVPPGQVYYLDDGSATGAIGEMASLYDIPYDLQYCYTFVRNVRGMEDESGPSPISKTVNAGTARSVLFSGTVDGFLDSDQVVTPTGVAVVTPVNNDTKNMVRFSIAAVAYDTVLAMWYMDLAKDDAGQPMRFGLLSGDFVRFPDTVAIADKAFQIKLVDDSDLPHERLASGADWINTSRIWFEDASVSVVAPGGHLERFVSETLATVQLASNNSDVIFTTVNEHCFYTGQRVSFSGVGAIYPQVFSIVVDPIDRKKFYISGATFDRSQPNFGYGTTVGALKSMVTIPSGTYATFPHDGDAVFLALAPDAGSPPSATALNGWFRARVGTSMQTTGQIIVDEPCQATFSSTLGVNQIKYIPNNDYIYARRLYRIGDTGEFLKVKDVPLWETTFVDARANILLSDAISSNYTDNGIEVLYDAPPVGMREIISHYDMKFGIIGNSVRWTPNGVPDAWPEQYSQEFKYEPLAIRSWEQGVLVLCEDALYMLVGNTASTMSIAGTEAVDGCIAPGSVQATSVGVFYLSKRGLMLYQGGRAECVTELRIFPKTLLGTSRFTGDQELTRKPYYFLLSRHSYLYRSMVAADQPLPPLEHDPIDIDSTEPSSSVIPEIGSFYVGGRYYMYWADQNGGFQNDGGLGLPSVMHNNYECHTMICVDTYSEGMPITTLGLKPKSVFVTEKEDAVFLVSGAGEAWV